MTEAAGDIAIAPIRTFAHVRAAELRDARAPAAPWDPWPEARIGYPGRSGDLLWPPAEAMRRLEAYLVQFAPPRFER